MKQILVIGHMSPESSHEYQRIMCQEVRKRLGGDSSPEFIFLGLNFETVRDYLNKCDYDGLHEFFADRIYPFVKMVYGAMICTNTVHIVVPCLEKALGVPFIHIADCAGDYAISKGFKKAALLGTKRTMTEDFYKKRLGAKRLEVIVPNEKAQDYIDFVIHDKLCKGIILEEDRRIFCHIIEELRDEGAEAVILGCTEIPLLIKDGDACLPVIDTLRLHALAAVDFMLG